jgi:hypothetical protein
MFIVRGIIAMFQALTGSGLVGAFERAHERKLAAENDKDKLMAELDIERIGAALQMAEVRRQDRWGASSLGAYLIVVPYGLWWTAIFAVQVLNPWLGWNLVVIDVPPRIHDMAQWLIPAIVIGDVGTAFTRTLRK